MADIQKTILLRVNLNTDQLQAAAKAAEVELIKLRAEKENLIATNQKDTLAYQQNAAAINQNTKILKDAGAAVQINQRLTDNNTGSLNDLQLTISGLTKQYYAMSQAQREAAGGIELQIQIKTLKDKFVDLNTSIGNSTPNIGRYGESLGVVSKGINGIGGGGVILSRVLGIDPAIAQGIREAGLALRDLQHTLELQKVTTQANTVVTQENNVVKEANTALQYENALGSEAAGTATIATTTATEEATVATGFFSKALLFLESINPFIYIAAGVALLAGAIFAIYENFIKLIDAQKAQQEINLKAIDIYAKEDVKVRELIQTASNLNNSYEVRVKAIEEAKKSSGGYLDNLTAENVTTNESIEAIHKYISALEDKAKAQAAEELYVEKLKEQLKLQQDGTSALDAAKATTLNFIALFSGGVLKMISTQEVFNDRIDKAREKTKAFGDAWQTALNQANKTQNTNSDILKNYEYQTEASLAIVKKGGATELKDKIQLLNDQFKVQTEFLDKTGNEYAAAESKKNEEIKKLTQDFNDKQIKEEENLQLSLLNIKKSSGKISDSDFEQQQYNIKKATLDKELNLYSDNADKQKEIQIALNNLLAENNKTVIDEKTKSIESGLTKDELALKNGYNKQLSILVESQKNTKDEIEKNNLAKLALQSAYEESLLQLQIKAEEDKRKLNPAANESGMQEFADAENKKAALQGQFDSKQIEDKKKLNEILNSIADNEFEQSIKFSEKYYNDQRDQLTQSYSDGKISKAEYERQLTQIQLEETKARLAIDKDYEKTSTKADADSIKTASEISKEKIRIAEQEAEQRKQIINDVAESTKTVLDAGIDISNNNAKASSDFKKKTLDDELAAKKISQAEYDKQTKQLQHDDAEREKEVGIEKILINTAVGIVKALAEQNYAGAVVAGVDGAAQLAVAESVAVPFALGGKVLGGHGIPITRSNGDNRLATVKTGEVVLNAGHQRALGGDKTFAAIGVPGFASGGFVNSIRAQETLSGLTYNDLIRAFSKQPAPIVKVQDINYTQAKVAKIADRANY